MGLFSNLFGNDGRKLDDAFGKMKNMADNFVDEDEARLRQGNTSSAPVEGAERMGSRAPFSNETDGPSGDSWGPRMPDEPNQYNSGRPYHDYFSRVFAEAFPSYQIDKKMMIGERGYIYTFTQAGATKLVVEVISARSSVYKVRNDCRKQGIPYIRFYHDYHGWWNTKSYVIRRTKEALGI